MSKTVRFYTIAFEDSEGKVLENSISDFLHNLNNILNNNIEMIKKELPNRNKIRIFSLLNDIKTDQFVIPFGKLKNNISYKEDNSSKNLSIVDYDIYDVNLMYYDGQHNIIILTQDRSGPSFGTIEKYLNLFVEQKEKSCIKINPIYKNDDIERIRKAKRINKINIKFDFSKNTQDFINKRLKMQNDSDSFLKSVKAIALGSKNIDAKNLQVSLSAENQKLDMISLMAFLDSIHIQDDFIKEIEVYYANGEKEKTVPARLKQSNIVLSDCFSSSDSITQEFLLSKSGKDNESMAQKIILRNINNFYPKVRDYFNLYHRR